MRINKNPTQTILSSYYLAIPSTKCY